MKHMRYDIFACPYCKSPVRLKSINKNDFLECKCGKKFPLQSGIPIFSEAKKKKIFYEKMYGKEYETMTLSDTAKKNIENSLKFIHGKSHSKINYSLDIGCNPAMTKFISEKTGSAAVGINITDKGMYEGGQWAVGDIEDGLPFASETFDLVFCGDLIEHTTNTEYFVAEIGRVMKKDGYLILTTPNMASFWNRIFLLMGYQPHQLGVSEKKGYGNPFIKWDRYWGHTRVFTHRALKEFLKDNGFVVLKISGGFIRNPYDRPLKRSLRKLMSKAPSLAECLVCICRKA